MDKSLDELIKITRKSNAKKPAIKKVKQQQQAKAGTGRKGGRGGKGAAAKVGSALGVGKVKLGGIGKKSKVRRAMKGGGAGMDVEMGGGKRGGAKAKTPGKGAKAKVVKLADTLKNRIAQAIQRKGGKITPKAGGASKASEIKVTIAGMAKGASAPKPNAQRAKAGTGGGLAAMISNAKARAAGGKGGKGGGGGGGIVKPGQQQPKQQKANTLAGISKKAKNRQVIVTGKSKPKQGPAGRNGGQGNNKGRGGKNTLAARFGRR